MGRQADYSGFEDAELLSFHAANPTRLLNDVESS